MREPRRSKAACYERLQQKKDRLDWEKFHLLENLFVFCIVREFKAPRDRNNPVHFRISREAEDTSLCLLFKIDRDNKDPLIREPGTPRPDYLALYVTEGRCIFTIIEIKGTTEKGGKHGIEQITTFRDILKRELQAHLPFGSKAVIQGILLSALNTQSPDDLIMKEAKNGFIILPIKWNYNAELFPYISKQNQLTERYQDEKCKHSEDSKGLEHILIHGALQDRISDSSHRAASFDKNRTGIYLNYVLSSQNEYAVWKVDERQNIVYVKAIQETLLDGIKQCLHSVGFGKITVSPLNES